MSSERGEGLALVGVRKAFRNLVAVDDLTVDVPRGSLFGLLGANGAGKTTTLRMILNILTPDRGTIYWGGKRVDRIPRHSFGYLPEERGLYPKMKTGEELVFLAGLNDLSSAEATRRARLWLGRVSLGDAWNRKIEELSKGNQQKVQVLAAILHDPELMMLDEPFSGLDPINTEVLRDTLFERQSEGRTIVFSSHRLEQVEEICDRVAIIHKGKLLLAGRLADIKRSTVRVLLELAFVTAHDGPPLDLEPFVVSLLPLGVAVLERHIDGMRLELPPGVSSDRVLQLAITHGPSSLRRFEVVEPSLQEIFIEAVGAVDPEAVEQVNEESAALHGKVITEG